MHRPTCYYLIIEPSQHLTKRVIDLISVRCGTKTPLQRNVLVPVNRLDADAGRRPTRRRTSFLQLVAFAKPQGRAFHARHRPSQARGPPAARTVPAATAGNLVLKLRRSAPSGGVSRAPIGRTPLRADVPLGGLEPSARCRHSADRPSTGLPADLMFVSTSRPMMSARWRRRLSRPEWSYPASTTQRDLALRMVRPRRTPMVLLPR